LKGGTARDLAVRVREWFKTAGTDHRLFLYWAGHAKREDALYLVTRDSPSSGLDHTNAVPSQFLAKSAANSQASKVLIVLDACFSGAALGDAIKTISSVIDEQAPNVSRGRGMAVLASAHALEKAREGIVCEVLKDALTGTGAARPWSDNDRFIDWDRFYQFIEEEVASRAPDQHILPATLGKTRELVANPRYRPGVVAEVVEERAGRLSRSGSAAHFDLAARGIEVGGSGWYFAGRTRLLRALVDWLKTADHGIRIVTGPPGAGKSAVMGRLATLSDPEFRKAAIGAGVTAAEDDGTVPPQGIIDVAVHAKGKTLDECTRALAHGLGIGIDQGVSVDIDAVVAAIGKLARRVTVMLDALDEAAMAQGAVIASRLLLAIGTLPRVRVLVGSRRSVDGAVIPAGEERHGRLRALFGPSARIDDLSDEAETRDDIAEYVRGRLGSSARHRGDHAGIEVAAERVAARADGSFLYARIVSRTLQELPRLDGGLPAGALEAFAQDLRARFGADEKRVDDLLAALAWAEGGGLTRRVWPLVAGAIAEPKRSYDEDDVGWALRHAGWHIIETGKDGQAVYRLAHQALTDHYSRGLKATDTQQRIVAALTQGIEGADWVDCDRYLWRHLAAHAAQAGSLHELIRDPDYLAVAEPAALVAALPSVRDEQGRRFADIYNRVADRLIEERPLDRFPYIHMTAQIEAPDLAAFLNPPLATPWVCRWARVRPSTPHRVVGRHSDSVSAVALDIVEQRAVVASGSFDRTVRLWDAGTGTAVSAPLWHDGAVMSTALAVVEGRVLVASGSEVGTLHLWDARTGAAISAPLKGASSVLSVALGTVEGRALVASGSKDGFVRLWDAQTGAAIGTPLEGHADAVCSVALGAVQGRAVVASGSWDGTVRLWNAHTGAAISAPLEGTSPVKSVALGTVEGRALVASGSNDGLVRLWDAQTGAAIGTPLEGHADAVCSVALGAVQGRAVVASGGWDGTVRLWDARTGAALDAPLQGHTSGVTSVAVAVVEGRAVVISGSYDGTVRLWDLRTDAATGTLAGNTGQDRSVAFGTVSGRPILASASYDNTIRLWDASTGAATGALAGNTGQDRSVAFGTVSGRPILASASYDNTIRLWDASTGAAIGAPLEALGTVTSVALGMFEGRAVVASGSEDGTVRLWDARTGAAKGAPLQGGGGSVQTVAVGVAMGRTFVAASTGGTVRLWDAHTGAAVGPAIGGGVWMYVALATAERGLLMAAARADCPSDLCLRAMWTRPDMGNLFCVPRPWDERTQPDKGSLLNNLLLWAARTWPIGGVLGALRRRVERAWPDVIVMEHYLVPHMDQITAVALGVIEGSAVVIAGGTNGAIHLWDAQTGADIGPSFKGHTGSVRSLALGAVEGCAVLVSGGDDGTVRMWDMRSRIALLVVRMGQEVKSVHLRSDIGLIIELKTGLLAIEVLPAPSNEDI
jgi:WD40 repeat protein